MRISKTAVGLSVLPFFLGEVAAQTIETTTGEDVVNVQTVEQAIASRETLESALIAAYTRNPTILAQRKARGVSVEQLEQAKSRGRPQVGLSASSAYARNESNQGFGGAAAADSYTIDGVTNTLGLQATQSLYSGGAIAAGVSQARAGLKASDEQVRSAEQTLILQVIAAYLDVSTAESEVDIRRNNVAVLKKQVQAAQDRFDVGEVTRTDVAQAEARFSGSEAQLATSRATLEANRATYEELVGRHPVQLETVPEAPARPDTIEVALASAMDNNPDLMALKANVEAAEYAIKSAKGARRPNVSVSAAAGLSRSEYDDAIEQENASVTANLSIPLYQGGALSSQVRSAQLQRDQAKYQLRAAERNLTANVARSWHSVIATERAIAASERQVGAAEIAFEGAEQELAVGLRTTLDVLDQEQELLEARLQLIQAERNAYLAKHELLAAMGVLTPETLGVNIPLDTPVDHADSEWSWWPLGRD